MSKVFVGAVMAALCLCGTCLAYEGVSGSGFGYAGDPWNAGTAPGLRFGGTPEVRTGDHGGGYSFGGCDSCGTGGCVHWALLPWTGSWDGDGHGHGCKKHGGCGF